MRNLNRFALLTAGLPASSAPSAWVDGYACTKAEIAAANADMKKAEDLARAGNWRAAYAATDTPTINLCAVDLPPWRALRKRAAHLIAADEEKNGRFQKAYEWYWQAASIPDAGRMQHKLVEAQPQDINVVGQAVSFFKEQNDPVQEKAMRGYAAQNIERLLALEQQKFIGLTRVTTTQYLGDASNWAYLALTGQDRIKARQLQRGDTLAVETSPRELQGAINFYEQAGADDRAAKVKVRARALADANLKKGDTVTAAALYKVAGDNDKAETVAKAGAARTAQDKEARHLLRDQQRAASRAARLQVAMRLSSI